MGRTWGAVALRPRSSLRGAERAHTLAWQSWKRQCSLPGTRRNVCPGLPKCFALESECLPGTRELLASRHWARSRRSRSRCPARDARIERHKQIMKPQRVFDRESRVSGMFARESECLPGTAQNVCPGTRELLAARHGARSRRSRSRCAARVACTERHKQIMEPLQRVFARESRGGLPGTRSLVCHRCETIAHRWLRMGKVARARGRVTGRKECRTDLCTYIKRMHSGRMSARPRSKSTSRTVPPHKCRSGSAAAQASNN